MRYLTPIFVIAMWMCALSASAKPTEAPSDINEQEISINHGKFVFSSAVAPPSEYEKWEEILLPDQWKVSKKGNSATPAIGWYRLEFVVGNRAPPPSAIYLPRSSMNAGVFLDGRFVGGTPTTATVLPRDWNYPLLIEVPTADLAAGSHVIHVRIQDRGGDLTGLGKVYIGDALTLEKRRFKRWLIQIAIPELSSMGIFLCLIATAVLWWHLHSPLDGLFTLTGTICVLRLTDFYSTWLPFPDKMIPLVMAVLVNWFVVLLILFATYLLEFNSRFTRQALLLIGVAGMASLAFWNNNQAESIARVLYATALAIGLVGLVFLAPRTRILPKEQRISVIAGAGTNVVFGIHDAAQNFGLLSPDEPRLSFLGIPFLVFTIGSPVISRHVRAAKKTAQLKVEFESAFIAKSSEMEALYRQMLAEELERAANNERQIIMREMHDGLGANLTLAISSLEQANTDPASIRAKLQECMLELRVLVDSIEPSNNDLISLLGNMRQRLEPSLNAGGVEVQWQVTDIAQTHQLSSRDVLNILRIFQEALVNVVKHSNANAVILKAYTDASSGDTIIRLRDNGTLRAQRTASRGSGMGLRNMHARAQEVGGTLNVSTNETGTTVEFRLPELPPKFRLPRVT